MSGTIHVEPDPDYPGGHALLRLRGAGTFGGPARFWIKRDDYHEGSLGPNGWQVADALLTPDSHSVEGNDLLLHVGPAVVHNLDSAIYRIAVPDVGVNTAVYWPDLPLLPDEALTMVAASAPGKTSAAATVNAMTGRTRQEAPRKPLEAGGASVRPDDGQSATGPGPDGGVNLGYQPIPIHDQDVRRHNWLPLTAVLLVVLAVAGAGGYFGYQWLFPPSAVAPSPAAPPGPQASPAAPDLTRMSAAEALRSGASPQALVEEAQRRMQLDAPQRSEALLLLQGAADRDYAPAHAALGRLYDPNIQHPPDIRPDARQAASHYRLAVNGGDTSVADAQAALRTYLQQQVGLGNLFAPLILKEFWP